MFDSSVLMRESGPFQLFTSKSWMQIRRSRSDGLRGHVDDLQRLAIAYETHRVEDLSKRTVLSFAEYLDRKAYREVPFSLIETLWLIGADPQVDVLPIIEMLPRIATRIGFLADYAGLLQREGRYEDSALLVEAAEALLLSTDSTAYDDIQSCRNLCERVVKLHSSCRNVSYDLLDRLVAELRNIQEFNERDGDGSGIDHVVQVSLQGTLKSVIEILGRRNEIDAAIELIEHAINKWFQTDRAAEARTELRCSLATGLADSGNYGEIEQLLSELDLEEDVVAATWIKVLFGLVDACEESWFKAFWKKIEMTRVGTDFRQKLALSVRHNLGIDVFGESWEQLQSANLVDLRKDELKSWLLLQLKHNLWKRNFDEASRLLSTWTHFEEMDMLLPFAVTIDTPVFRRMCLLDRTPSADFGSIGHRDQSMFYLLVQEQFELVHKLVSSTAAFPIFGGRYLVRDPSPGPDFRRLVAIKDWPALERWLSELPLSSSDEAASESTSSASFIVYCMARGGQVKSAEEIIRMYEEREPRPSYSEIGMLWRAVTAGITVGQGVEAGRQFIRDKDIEISYDYSADLWITARALMAVGRLDEALELIRKGSSPDPGYRDAWLDIAGAFAARLEARQLAEKLALSDLKIVADIGRALAIADPIYATRFVTTALWRVTEPMWETPNGVSVSRDDRLLEKTADAMLAVLGNGLLTDALPAVLRIFRALQNMDYSMSMGVPEFPLLLILDQGLWVGSQLVRVDSLVASKDQVVKLLDSVSILERTSPPSIRLPTESAFLFRTSVYLWARLGADASVFQEVLEQLERTVPDTLDTFIPAFILPAELARFGSVERAGNLGHCLVDVVKATFRSVLGDEQPDELKVPEVEKHIELQIALNAPSGSEQLDLLRQCCASGIPEALLLQALTFCGMRNDENSMEILLQAVERSRAESDEVDNVTMSSNADGLAPTPSLRDPGDDFQAMSRL